jgi:ribosomal protein S6--L-glutamate ligase
LVFSYTTEDLLHLIEGYGLERVIITKDSPFVGRSLVEANTLENEFWVVGIERGKEWIPLPRSREVINEGDKLVAYGNLNILKRMFR